ncbi:MAG: AI-2E family transporter [Lachnospiraceae bacterium]|nr:AI-2E family transporter [Lachnospiraceae bacterium]
MPEKEVNLDIIGTSRIRNRINENPHYLHWGITAFCVIASSILFCYFLFNFSKITDSVSETLRILRPVIYGLVLAYLLNPIVTKIEDRVLAKLWDKYQKSKREKDPAAYDAQEHKQISFRGLSILITVFAVFVVLYLFFINVIPQLLQSIQTIAAHFPDYAANLEEYIGKFLSRNPELHKTVNTLLDNYNKELNDILNTKIIPMLNDTITRVSGNILSSVAGVLTTLWNLVIGLIISIYLLASKEHFAGQSKKVIYSVLRKERANQTIENIRFVNHTFGDYIRGKLVDSLIIGLICFIGMTCLAMPYSLLISVIVGVTNIIPFFGPYLGAIPSALLILMVDPKKALIFIIFILILQQFDGNFLGPKILGESTGLSSFWILFSITLMGGYFGVPGMAVGVPVFAIIYAALRSLVRRSLRKKGLSVKTSDYISLWKIRGSEYVPLPEKKELRKEIGSKREKKEKEKEKQ